MLRALPVRTRCLVACPIGRVTSSQLRLAPSHPAVAVGQRYYADSPQGSGNTKPSIHDSKTAVFPGSKSSATDQPLPPGAPSPPPTSPKTPATPSSSSSVPPESIPKLTGAPKSPASPNAPKPTSVPPPPPPPPIKTAKPRRFRKYLITLITLGGLAFGGGVVYSLQNDSFHEFFTEYVPFGEEAVLFFEEREFRRRFPAAAERALGRARDTGKAVTIPSKSGVSWNIQDSGKDSSSKAGDKQPLKDRVAAKAQDTKDKVQDKVNQSISTVKDGAQKLKPEDSKHAPTEPKKAAEPEPKKEAPVESKARTLIEKGKAKVEEKAPVSPPQPQGRFAPITRIDPLNIKSANDPLVQDLVSTLNNVITVINADTTPSKYASTIAAAKAQITSIGERIVSIKKSAQNEADAKIAASHTEFDAAAKELIARLEGELHDQESRWKEEFDAERKKLSEAYQSRLKTELSQARDVAEKKLKNSMLEQEATLKRDFTDSIQKKVETERNARLGKLTELASSVNDLESLTAAWKSVLDANLRTQHLHVAVEAVRHSLETADRPIPFVRELAALKEIAQQDSVVNAAIASINPSAYQKGLLTSAQLIERFRRVAVEVRKAGLLDEESGVASHAASAVLSKLMFKKEGSPEGQDIDSVLTRTELLLEEGDIDAAAREMNGLDGWAKALSRDWLGEARKILEVRQALDVIATQARLESLRVD